MSELPGWKAGAASAALSVPDRTPMAGYAAREGGAEGTLYELTVGCLALEANGRRFLLVAIDLIGVDETMVGELVDRLGVLKSSIAFCASHTHSGPAGVLARLHPAKHVARDPRLRAEVLGTAERVARDALSSLKDAIVTFAQSRVAGVAANRNHPDGPFDPTVSVISARTPDGRPIATVVHFACHPTILPAASRVISAEFPGAVRRLLPAGAFGTVLFANGAAGDVSTRFTRRSQSIEEVERVGELIAGAVQSATDVVTLAPSIEIKRCTGVMRLRDRADFDLAHDAKERAKAELARGDLSGAERRIAETRLQGAQILARMADRVEELSDRVPVTRWSLGQLRLYGFPGELFASLGNELVRGEEPALVLGYTNGYLGYFPDRAAYESGTYEALASPYAPGASEELIAWVRKQCPVDA